jgi:hypothetical protein
MAIEAHTTVRRTVVVATFTGGLPGPDVARAGPVANADLGVAALEFAGLRSYAEELYA